MLNAFTGSRGREIRLLVTSSTVLACVVSTFYFAYVAGETVIYTHFYYAPVVMSGLWYRRRGLIVPFLLVASYLCSIQLSDLPMDADIYLRSVVLIFVGLTVGELSNLSSRGQAELARYRDHLEELVKDRTADLSLANEKLELMGKITRHDTINSLSVLSGWLELARDSEDVTTCKSSLEKARDAEGAMRRSLEFAGDYERVGARSPQWLFLRKSFSSGLEGMALEGISVSNGLPEIEVHADPMLDKVFRNLVDNSVRHGGAVHRIAVSAEVVGKELVIVYTDDGRGIAPEDRGQLFQLGFGRHTGFGLYFARKALGMTGISIDERGTAGTGARFVMTVPEGRFRSVGPGN